VVIILNIVKKILEACRGSWEKNVITYRRRAWNYRELFAESERIAAHLQGLKVEKGEHVALYFNNDPNFVFASIGALLNGNAVVPIAYSASRNELNGIMTYCDVKVCISNVPRPSDIDPSVMWVAMADLASSIVLSGSDLEREKRILSLISASQDDIAFLMPTSGTTGKSKVVMLSHDNIVTNALAHGNRLLLGESDNFCVTMPMHFSSTITTQMVAAMLFRAELSIMSLPLVPKVFLNHLKEKRSSCFSAVPTILRQLFQEMEKLELHEADLCHIDFVVVSGAPVPAELFEESKRVFRNAEILQTYGLTEASPRVSMMGRGDTRYSCGKPVDGVIVKVTDVQDSTYSGRRIGEILVKGPNVMRGYYKNEETTAATIIDNWLYTGDLGYIDEDGCLTVTGRKKNIIIVGGANVYPEEVEEMLSHFEEIKESIVLGESDALMGEVPIAYLTLRNGMNIDVEELRRRCLKRLSAYKVPKKWYIMDELPKTSTGKLARFTLSQN
jgi:long-chain acyl-CoA synthetase